MFKVSIVKGDNRRRGPVSSCLLVLVRARFRGASVSTGAMEGDEELKAKFVRSRSLRSSFNFNTASDGAKFPLVYPRPPPSFFILRLPAASRQTQVYISYLLPVLRPLTVFHEAVREPLASKFCSPNPQDGRWEVLDL
jgi:hypothetical protein